MPMYTWKAQITLNNGQSHQEVFVQARSVAEAKQMIIAQYSGCRITWGAGCGSPITTGSVPITGSTPRSPE